LVATFVLLTSACASDPGGGGKRGQGGDTAGEGGSGGSSGEGGSSGQGGSSGKGGSSGIGGSAGNGGTSGQGGSSGQGGGGATGGMGGTTPVGGADGGTTESDAGPPVSGGMFDCTAITGAGAKFCNDFEGFPAGQAPAGKWTTNGKVVIDSTKSFSGKQSLKFSGPKGSFDSRMKFGTDFLPVGGHEFHGRYMVYFTDIPNKANGGNGCHFDLALASGPGGTYILGGMYGNFMGVYHPGDCSLDSNQAVPTKKWACVQWEFSGEPGKTHLFRMSLNGKPMPGGELTDAGPANCGQTAAKRWQPPSEFTSLNFGWVNYQTSPIPIEMWVDDFAFGPKPIPCPEGLE
jgi:hypothetical protein